MNYLQNLHVCVSYVLTYVELIKQLLNLLDWERYGVQQAIKYSALNLVPIREGDDERTAINDMVKLAQHLD
jgi:hypothetical protein